MNTYVTLHVYQVEMLQSRRFLGFTAHRLLTRLPSQGLWLLELNYVKSLAKINTKHPLTVALSTYYCLVLSEHSDLTAFNLLIFPHALQICKTRIT